jgi:hypothetical protein
MIESSTLIVRQTTRLRLKELAVRADISLAAIRYLSYVRVTPYPHTLRESALRVLTDPSRLSRSNSSRESL